MNSTNVTIIPSAGSFEYATGTGSLEVSGGAAIMKDIYVNGQSYLYGDVNVKGNLNLLQGVQLTGIITGAQIVTPFHGNSVEDVNYIDLLTGALTTDGGFGVREKYMVTG